ncbi:hypothetical protein H257_15271 [Aphanomyces astaci]|uniref:Uncharacterized protein n=1 Tax=Aphanomyces astaci TaxID=112090 RepID=W4FN81_APHAT|nr:hypothetical protein H257_15271 [Aphanomyces astaci]ETV68930.1 hypothetical protein H257_15271 [Aphanomyces astaci]|eukprot:XP_009841607.1 hypothetical protein H257_15271 [Aphanomyces astaci]
MASRSWRSNERESWRRKWRRRRPASSNNVLRCSLYRCTLCFPSSRSSALISPPLVCPLPRCLAVPMNTLSSVSCQGSIGFTSSSSSSSADSRRRVSRVSGS